MNFTTTTTTITTTDDFYDYPLIPSLNYTNLFSTINDKVPPPAPTFLLLFVIFIFIFSIIGNSLVLYAVMVSKKTTINMLIANHAVAGICRGVVLVPYYHYFVSHSMKWIGGSFFCKFLDFSQSTLVIVTAFTLLTLSCYNYREVISPLGEKPAKKVVVVVCLVLWGVAVLLASPFFIFLNQHYNLGTERYDCYFEGPNPLFDTVYSKSVRMFEYFLPIVVLIVVFVFTWRTLHKNGGGAYGGEMLRKREETKMLTTIAILFAILHAPFQIISLVLAIIVTNESYHSSFILFNLVSNVPTCLNPVVYLKMGPDLKGVMSRLWARVGGGCRG